MKVMKVTSGFKPMKLPTVNVDGNPFLEYRRATKNKAAVYALQPELKGEDVEAVYKKGLLATPEFKGLVPDNLFRNINDEEIPHKKFGGQTPSLLAVRGTLATINGKKAFIAQDAYTLEGEEPKFLPEVNLFLAHSLLSSKGFNVVPWFLKAESTSAGKSDENRKLAAWIKEACEKYGWPCIKVSVNHKDTRDYTTL